MPGTIVLVHGMWGGSWVWDNYRSVLEREGYACLTPVLRHHDLSPGERPNPALGNTSLLDYAQDLADIARGLGEPPILIGHSMGGFLALKLAEMGLAEALVMLAPAPPAGIFNMGPSVVRAFGGAMSSWKFWHKPIKQTYEEAAFGLYNLVPPEERRVYYQRSVYESGRAASELGWYFLDRRHASRVDPSKILCPALLIGGEQDRVVPPRVARKTAERYGAEFVSLADHAHWLVGEPGWENVARLVIDWLARR